MRDTSQYVSGEVVALEHEQNQIDKRAAEVEAALRSVMDTGLSALNSTVLFPGFVANFELFYLSVFKNS